MVPMGWAPEIAPLKSHPIYRGISHDDTNTSIIGIITFDMTLEQRPLTDPIRDTIKRVRSIIANKGVSIRAQKRGDWGEALQYESEQLNQEIESLKEEVKHHGKVQ